MSEFQTDPIQRSPLWGHLTKILGHIISERPGNALESFVPTSHYVLTGNAVPPKEPSVYSSIKGRAQAEHSDVPVDAFHNPTWAANFSHIMAPPKPPRKPMDGEDEEEEEMGGGGGYGRGGGLGGGAGGGGLEEEEDPEDFAMQGTLHDVQKEQLHFNAVGVGLPPEESFRVVVGLRALMRSEPLASASLWGVIHGSRRDYYIAETKLDPARLPEEEEEDGGEGGDEMEEEGRPVEAVAHVFFQFAAKRHRAVPAEEAGTGLNEYMYYAASTLDPTKWTRLPDVTPSQVSVARLLRNRFTGDLEAPVPSHPRFPGVEKHYLRAQIARITCTCKIAPKDLYTTEGAVPEEEDDEDEDEDEDGHHRPPPTAVPAYGTLPPLLPQEIPDEDDAEGIQPVQVWYGGYPDDELLQGKYWVHIAPTLLRDGRTTLASGAGRGAAGGGGDGEEGMELDLDDGAEPDDPVDNVEMIHPFLSDLSKDAPLSFPGHSRPQFNAWTFRKAYQHESSKRSIYLARSLLWPGGMTYAVTERGVPGATFRMIYIGSGLKNLQGANYFPMLPPKPMLEYVEGNLLTQRDCTIDEELEYAPKPPKPPVEDDEEVEEED